MNNSPRIDPYITARGDWTVSVYGEELKLRTGKVRRFKSKDAAIAAAEKQLKIYMRVAGMEPKKNPRGGRNVTEELEALIDATSLQHVLVGLELICNEKADHIRSNWQNEPLARLWDKASTVCGNAARDKRVEALP